MSGRSKEEQARQGQKSGQALAKEKHQHKVLDEERDHLEEIAANTAYLREQRLARETALRAAALKVRPKKGQP